MSYPVTDLDPVDSKLAGDYTLENVAHLCVVKTEAESSHSTENVAIPGTTLFPPCITDDTLPAVTLPHKVIITGDRDDLFLDDEDADNIMTTTESRFSSLSNFRNYIVFTHFHFALYSFSRPLAKNLPVKHVLVNSFRAKGVQIKPTS